MLNINLLFYVPKHSHRIHSTHSITRIHCRSAPPFLTISLSSAHPINTSITMPIQFNAYKYYMDSSYSINAFVSLYYLRFLFYSFPSFLLLSFPPFLLFVFLIFSLVLSFLRSLLLPLCIDNLHSSTVSYSLLDFPLFFVLIYFSFCLFFFCPICSLFNSIEYVFVYFRLCVIRSVYWDLCFSSKFCPACFPNHLRFMHLFHV